MPAPAKNSRITLRQYLIFGGLERGWPPAKAEAFVEGFKEKRPHLSMSDKATYDEWERRRKDGMLR